MCRFPVRAQLDSNWFLKRKRKLVWSISNENNREIVRSFLANSSLKGWWFVLGNGSIPLMSAFVRFCSSPVVKFASVETDRLIIVSRKQKNACNMYGINGVVSLWNEMNNFQQIFRKASLIMRLTNERLSVCYFTSQVLMVLIWNSNKGPSAQTGFQMVLQLTVQETKYWVLGH